jgi:RNA polymerase sigma factor (sigma-70 family)
MSKIFIVDDEPFIVDAIQAMLDLNGFESESAPDRATAEERIAGEFFPIILSDLRMRLDDDGFHLLDAVQRLSPRSRVATLTGYADAETVKRLHERGATLVLSKPFTEEQLMAAIGEMLQVIEQAHADADAEAGDDNDEELYEATVKTLKRVARVRFGFPTADAEELVQEAWLLFLEKRHAVRAPRTWLTGTVANLCRQEIARRYRAREREAEPQDRGALPSSDAVLAIRQALERVDERSRTLCTMIGLEQRSYEEVSLAAGIPLGSVGPLYMRAKARLREAVG